MQRQLAIWVVVLSALFSTVTFFLKGADEIQTYGILIAIIVSGFALLLGVDSLILYHSRNIQRGKNTIYSGVLLISFWLTIIWGAFAWWRYGSPFAQNSSFMWLFNNVYLPLDATMFSILAFYNGLNHNDRESSLRGGGISDSAGCVYVHCGTVDIYKCWEVVWARVNY